MGREVYPVEAQRITGSPIMLPGTKKEDDFYMLNWFEFLSTLIDKPV
jgi:hypothetical protein